MNRILLFFIKPLSFLPALLMMYAIYSFSAQTGTESGNLSYMVSVKVVEIGNEALDKNLEDWEIEEVAENIEYYVRKAAHMTEYFLLAIAVSFPLYVYGLRGFPLLLIAGIICVGFACGDEYHQSFVDGRGPSVKDVCIDSVGVFFGIMLVRIVCWTFLAPVRMIERLQRRQRRKQARLERQAIRRAQSSARPHRSASGSSGRAVSQNSAYASSGNAVSRQKETLKREGKRHVY